MSLSLPVFDNIASTTADITWMQMEWVIATYLVRGQQPAILGKKPVINKVKNPFHLTKSDMKTHSAMGQQEHITGSPYTLVQSTFSLGKFWKKSIHIYTSLSLQHKTKIGGFQWSHGAMCTDMAEYGNL